MAHSEGKDKELRDVESKRAVTLDAIKKAAEVVTEVVALKRRMVNVVTGEEMLLNGTTTSTLLSASGRFNQTSSSWRAMDGEELGYEVPTAPPLRSALRDPSSSSSRMGQTQSVTPTLTATQSVRSPVGPRRSMISPTKDASKTIKFDTLQRADGGEEEGGGKSPMKTGSKGKRKKSDHDSPAEPVSSKESHHPHPLRTARVF